ncbi:hypothetical protein GCM10010196_10290 [Agromyces mediolanus]|uniref:HTH cro/C1-type domain-containing protein n=1 Tax=Agromyces mediolanus TaxID=41986 RepID=A0A918CES8_AGRME|nr:helix-turn-helix domain-containing protein [Agromyces mediolanus]GGR19050.1 hypothetical protein GCM10010196_10290 [Agromyces mediolanus]GLJ71356.1 hypothetical protein GCM10017583_06120 [Agromyces mediolanus]
MEISAKRAAQLLRAARLSQSIPQAELARRAGTAQPDLSLIERGRRTPTVDTLERILRSAGHQLIAAPVLGLSGVEAAAEIASSIEGADGERAFRVFLSYSDALKAADATGRVVLTAAEPAAIGDPKWDAAVAGLSAYWLERGRLPIPGWLARGDRRLPEATPLDLGPYVGAPDPDRVPTAFLERNVLLDESTLASV